MYTYRVSHSYFCIESSHFVCTREAALRARRRAGQGRAIKLTCKRCLMFQRVSAGQRGSIVVTIYIHSVLKSAEQHGSPFTSWKLAKIFAKKAIGRNWRALDATGRMFDIARRECDTLLQIEYWYVRMQINLPLVYDNQNKSRSNVYVQMKCVRSVQRFEKHEGGTQATIAGLLSSGGGDHVLGMSRLKNVSLYSRFWRDLFINRSSSVLDL